LADKIVDDITNPINTNFAPTLSEQKVGPLTTTVLVAGDDADAKSVAPPSYVDGLASHHQPGTMPSL
jgi:hypothetical protein